MVWIQSCDDDLSTNLVIDWLEYLGVSWFRTNSEPINLKILRISSDTTSWDFAPTTLERTISIDEIHSYWYRRGYNSLGSKVKQYSDGKKAYNDFLREESLIIKDYINEYLRNKRSINNFHDNNLNKLTVLNRARAIGWDIPSTYILTRKKDLLAVLKCKSMICKSLYVSSIPFRLDGVIDGWGTIRVNKKQLKLLPDNFFPSIVQDEIAKLFDIRIFYFARKIFSSAIFSQNDPQTKVDFRNYNWQRPNRVVPIQLPINVEQNIFRLADSLGINSGSVDLIYGCDKKYYFLEINPIGQFHQVSYPCNYQIEKHIAIYLANDTKEGN